jgi:hypothetical protein
MKVVLMFSQVLGKVGNAMGEERYLDLCRPHIALVRLEVLNELLFLFCRCGHAVSPTNY